MNAKVIFIGIKGRVLAIAAATGEAVWSTALHGNMGQSFVTVLSDGERIYAYTRGHLHCLESVSGRILWTNDLPSCGYGFASLALLDGASAPGPSIVAAMAAQQQQTAAASSGAH